MEINLEKRKNMYLSSPPEIQKLYDSGGLKLREVAEKIGVVDASAYKNFALTVGDIILGMYQKESLGQLLKDRLKLSEEQVNTAVSELGNLLSQLPRVNQNKNAKPFVMPKLQAASEVISGEATEVREHMEHRDETSPIVKPLRTFSDDAHNVHGYGVFTGSSKEEGGNVYRSAQDSVLIKKNNDEKQTTLPSSYPQYHAPTVKKDDEADPSTEQAKTP